MKAVLPAAYRDLLEPRLPAGLDVCWFADAADAERGVVDAEVAWLDRLGLARAAATVRLGRKLKWLYTLGAGVESLDLELLADRGVILTNGSGLTSSAVAEYAVMSILVAAKRYDEVVRLTDRRAWTDTPPGSLELEGSKALIIGMGTIGRRIADLLAPFDVTVTGATRSGRDGTLKPDEWRARLGAFDWVVLIAPSTAETQALIGAPELAAMKPGAWLFNFARGDLVDQDALVAALGAGPIGGAFLDTVTPEPLPAEHPLWSAPNCLMSMHLSGRSQRSLGRRASELFLENLSAFLAGRPMRNVVDLKSGY